MKTIGDDKQQKTIIEIIYNISGVFIGCLYYQ
jgi:hypothetical protein